MNIFKCLFNQFSSKKFDNFLQYVTQELHLSILEKATTINPIIKQNFLGDISVIKEYIIENNNRHNIWRNSEIYFPITCLCYVNCADKIEKHLFNLKINLGIINLRNLDDVADGYYRLFHLYNLILHIHQSEKSWIKNNDFIKINQRKITIVYPLNQLYNDILSPNLYPEYSDILKHKSSSDSPFFKVDKPFSILKQYSSDLYDDFSHAISHIVFTPDLLDSLQSSFNCRLSYCGGIFINSFRLNSYGITEAMIHEYYHQRLWQWWSTENLFNFIYSDKSVIVSPITNKPRSLSVMIHAFLIYIGVLHFYNCQLHNNNENLSDKDMEIIVNRAKIIKQGIWPLYKALKEKLINYHHVRPFIEFLIEIFTSLELCF